VEALRADMFEEICPSTLLPFRIGGDKWAGLVIRCLEEGPRRFSELRVPLARVTPKVLTQSLRTLERDGFVRRRAYDEPVRRVTYELTDLGRSLLEPMRVVCEWTGDHWDELLDAREAQ
jgi:DNA-binding HxlR family transcriptional regulator